MASPALNFPPLDYHTHLFPDMINFHIERNPTFPIFAYPNNHTDELTEISFLEFGRAAHRVAHALRPSRQGSDGEVVMIIANTDTVLYQAITAGLSIAGWVPFPASPRNSTAAVVHMMKKINCSRIVTLEHAYKVLIDGVRRELGDSQLTILELPTLRDVFPKLGEEVAADSFIPYPSAPKRPNLDSPAIYIHSSGSTGFPKPIAHSYRIQNQWFARVSTRGFNQLPSPRRVATMALPPFHAFGIFFELYVPVAYLVTAVVYAPHTEHDRFAQPVIPTSDNMIECLKKVPSNTLASVPALLEPMATSDQSIEVLKKLDSVLFSGGPLPVKVGEQLSAAGVQLVNIYGGTEFGVLVADAHKQESGDRAWLWMHFADEPKIRWVPLENDTYELHVLSSDAQKMAVENLPDVKGYATSDVFVKHPTKDLWRVVGRADDVIILASGEKTVPGPMESIIGSSPLIQGVLVFGRERNQVGILVEPSPGHAINVKDEKAMAEFRNRIWPVIEEANKDSPAFSRIFKEMVLITSSDKPMLRTPKGTVQRKVTLDAYKGEIDALYESVQASSLGPEGLAEPSAWTTEVLEQWLLEHACLISPSNHVDAHSDLFAQGFDSLSATYLRNRILGAMRMSSDPEIKFAVSHIPPNVVFENPTIQLLGSWIAALINGDGARETRDIVEQHKQTINAMIEKYSVGLDGPPDGILPGSQPIEPAVVLLTGSTGGLGCFLLSELLNSSVVQRVYALNRPASIMSVEERQRSAFRDRKLPVELLNSGKVIYVEADTSLEKCGLSAARYEEIRDSVTLIIHNAWRLDFNLAISSFEDNVRASRNLVDLALESSQHQNLRFLFTSSIASAQSWDSANGPLPEEVQLDASDAVGAGYGEAKYATERIIVKSGLHATSFRIGQIVGGRHGGSWATTDWFPILVKSSIALGALPGSGGVASWIRQEDVASAILEAAFAREVPPPALNIFNPRGTPWKEIMASVRHSIVQRKGFGNEVLPIVPFGNWFAMLEKKAENASQEDLANIPAIKLLEFFRAFAQGERAHRREATEVGGMTTLSTAKIQRVSSTMANMQAIGEAEADAWVGYWIAKGAL